MRWFPVVLVALAIAVSAYILLEDDGDSGETTATEQGATLAELVEKRGKYVGEMVTVTAEIDEIVNQRLFLLGNRSEAWTRVAVLTDRRWPHSPRLSR